MTEENSFTNMDQNEFMKRMKAIASDLWGGISPPEEETPAPAAPEKAAPPETEKLKMEN